MQIGTSHFYDLGSSQLSKLSAGADTLNTQIATTKKFTDPSDDVVAYNRLSTIKQASADSNRRRRDLPPRFIDRNGREWEVRARRSDRRRRHRRIRPPR